MVACDQLTNYLSLVVAGFAGSTSLMKSCAIIAAGKILEKHAKIVD